MAMLPKILRTNEDVDEMARYTKEMLGKAHEAGQEGITITVPTPQQYWYCIIGPISGNTPPEADTPLRDAVQKAFNTVIGSDAFMCSSGWGVSEAEKERILAARPEIERIL